MNASKFTIFSIGLIASVLSFSVSAADSKQEAEAKQLLDPWPVTSIRVGRPTDKLEDVVKFYNQGLGLKVLYRFEDHAGFTGAMLGLPGEQPVHLEFTQDEKGSPGKAPSEENNLVLYIPDQTAIATIVKRLSKMGYKPVKAANPWWNNHCGVTINDPDGWKVILMPKTGFMHSLEYNYTQKASSCPAISTN